MLVGIGAAVVVRGVAAAVVVVVAVLGGGTGVVVDWGRRLGVLRRCALVVLSHDYDIFVILVVFAKERRVCGYVYDVLFTLHKDGLVVCSTRR